MAGLGSDLRNALSKVNPAEKIYTRKAIGEAESLKDYYRFLDSNPRTHAKLRKFLNENPSFLTRDNSASKQKLYASLRNKYDDNGNVIGQYIGGYSKFPQYMDNAISNGTVVKSPTPHDPNRLVFRRVPANAITVNDRGIIKSVDTANIPLPAKPVALGTNTRANNIVAQHMLGNRFGTPAETAKPALEFANRFEPMPFLGVGKYPSSPQYNPFEHKVTMPSLDGFRSFAQISSKRTRGADVGISRPDYMRSTYQHEASGHGGLYGLPEQQLMNETRRAMYNTNKALKGTGLVVNNGSAAGYDPMVEFMANYRAANPGTALRNTTMLEFDKGALGKLGNRFDKNMANVDADTVARIKSGLEQLDRNYKALVPAPYDKGNWAKYTAADTAIQNRIAAENNIPMWRKGVNYLSGKARNAVSRAKDYFSFESHMRRAAAMEERIKRDIDVFNKTGVLPDVGYSPSALLYKRRRKQYMAFMDAMKKYQAGL